MPRHDCYCQISGYGSKNKKNLVLLYAYLSSLEVEKMVAGCMVGCVAIWLCAARVSQFVESASLPTVRWLSRLFLYKPGPVSTSNDGRPAPVACVASFYFEFSTAYVKSLFSCWVCQRLHYTTAARHGDGGSTSMLSHVLRRIQKIGRVENIEGLFCWRALHRLCFVGLGTASGQPSDLEGRVGAERAKTMVR
ncbi:unnamed protein product [Ectocarpus sp. 12 AP-2014]